MHRDPAYTKSPRRVWLRRIVAVAVAVAVTLGVRHLLLDRAVTIEEQAIHMVFAEYRAALNARDGEAAAAQVGPATLVWYDALRGHALTADAAALGELRVIDRLLALTMRHLLPADRLEDLDGAGVFAAAVDGGWVAGDAADFGIAAVSVDGDAARATLTLRGQTVPLRLGFVRHDGDWRVEPASLATLLDENLRTIPRQLERDEDAWILEAVAEVAGGPVDATLWIPPRPADARDLSPRGDRR